jgi:Zn-dependent metalloprotease
MKPRAILLPALLAFIVVAIVSCSDSDKSVSPQPTKPPENPAVKAALEYIASNYPDMLEPPNSLVLKRADYSSLTSTWHIRFEQYYKGVRVYGAETIAHLRADYSMHFFDPTFYDGLDMDVVPHIPLGEAIRIGLNHQPEIGELGTDPENEELIIFHWDGTAYLSWHYFLRSDSAGDNWEYFIDAESGEIIYDADGVIWN